MNIHRSLAALALAAAVIATAVPRPAAGQATVADLRLVADESGTPIEPAPAPPGEKLYHFDGGADKVYVAFDVEGNEPTEVEIRITGLMGAILYQEPFSYDTPGTKIVTFDNKGVPLEDNEYVVNAYVGADRYLADSLQLTIGQAVIPTSQVGAQAPSAPTAQATLGATGGPATSPAGTGPLAGWTLVAAVAGMLALFGIVVWAGWSAMKRG